MALNYKLVVGTTDLTPYLKSFGQSHYVIVNEARDIQGNANFDIINRKTKLFCSFRPMMEDELMTFLSAIAPYNVDVTYIDDRTNDEETLHCYVGDHQEDYFRLFEDGRIAFKDFTCNFIEK